MIIFPAIDLRQGRCVRLRRGRPDAETLYSDDPVAVAERWMREGAQWLHVVNLDGAFGVSSPNLRIAGQIAASVEVPLQFGGGLRTLADIEKALGLGITRVILGTVALHQPQLVAQAIERFGPERIMVSIDAQDGRVAAHGWRELSDLEAVDLARRMRDIGVQRVVYTDISRDGMLTGVNVPATERLARESGLRVIAAGGVASLKDIQMLKAAEESGIEGVVIGQALYTGAISLPEALAVVEQR